MADDITSLVYDALIFLIGFELAGCAINRQPIFGVFLKRPIRKLDLHAGSLCPDVGGSFLLCLRNGLSIKILVFIADLITTVCPSCYLLFWHGSPSVHEYINYCADDDNNRECYIYSDRPPLALLGLVCQAAEPLNSIAIIAQNGLCYGFVIR